MTQSGLKTGPPPTRLGLVGCGQVAKKHFRALAALDDRFEIVGAVDPDAGARQWAAEATGTPVFEDLSQLWSAGPIDAVALATPTGLHPAQAREVAAAGAEVIVEKPLGTSLAEAKTMVDEVTARGRRLFVVKQLRHHPLFVALRRALRQGRFGRVHTVGLQVFWTRPQAYYDSAPWRGTRAADGGALMNQASHYVDLLDWLFGPVGSVHAIGGALGRRIEVEDTAVVSLTWEEGFVGSLHVTMLSYPENLATSLTVIGERGTVRLGGPACNEVQAWRFDESRPEDEQIEAAADQVFGVLRRGHEHVYRQISQDLRGARADIVDGAAGLRSLAIIDAAYRSLSSGQSEAVDALGEGP